MNKSTLIISLVILISFQDYNALAQEWENPIETSDWNTVWKSSFLESLDATNAPEPSGWFWGINLNHRSNSSTNRYNGQILIKNDHDNPTMYFRSTKSTGEGLWAKIIHDYGAQRMNGTLRIGGTDQDFRSILYLESGRQKLDFKTVDLNGGTDWNGTTLKIRGLIDSTPHQSIDFINDENYKEHIDLYTGNQLFNTRFSANGRVGIGTTSPQAKLHVNGNIFAAEVKVSTEATEVPDYVFKEDYKLTSLTDLEKYIKENHHLPEVPSASEVEAEGLDLAKMNLLLLKKIEELTLHTIEQEKIINNQADMLQNQNQNIESNYKLIQNLIQKVEKLENHEN